MLAELSMESFGSHAGDSGFSFAEAASSPSSGGKIVFGLNGLDSEDIELCEAKPLSKDEAKLGSVSVP